MPAVPHLDVDDNGLKDHYYCQCFPPNFYDNGYGRVTVKTTGIITYVSKGAGAFHISAPDCSVGYFAYRGGGDILSIGDEVTMNAKLASYYGSSQFSEIIVDDEVGGDGVLGHRHHRPLAVRVRDLLQLGRVQAHVPRRPEGRHGPHVPGRTTSAPGTAPAASATRSGHSCYVDSGAGDGTEIKVYGFCYFLAEDSAGNQMNVYAGMHVRRQLRRLRGPQRQGRRHRLARRPHQPARLGMQIDPYCYGDYPEGGYTKGALRCLEVRVQARRLLLPRHRGVGATDHVVVGGRTVPPGHAPAATDDDGDGGLSDAIAAATNDIGAVIGGAVGGGLGGTLLLIGICFGICYMRKKPAAAPQAQAKAVEVTQASKVPGTA